MACFLVPTTEAIVTTVIKHAADKKGSDNIFIKKMNWLNTMLWGGSALLAFEHVWHGEITYFPPFLTAMNNPEDTAEMIHEILTVGVSMDVALTVSWAAWVALTAHRLVSPKEA